MKNTKVKIISHLVPIISLCFILLAPSVSGQNLNEDFIKHFLFREIGPTHHGGRITSIAVVEQNPKIFYLGTASGGLWKTINNGITFKPIFDHEGSSSIGDVTVASSDANILWVGTGEANLRNSTYYGDGVYKSFDGGLTWEHMGLKESSHIGRILIHPKNPDIVYVAAQGYLYSENEERGVYKTINGGKTWSKVFEVVVENRQIGATDLVMDPRDPQILYATTFDRRRWAWSFRTGGPGSGIYKTSNGGTRWQKLTNGLPNGMIGKIGLAIDPQNPDVIYATIGNENSPGLSKEARSKELFAGVPPSKPTIGSVVYRTSNRGETWERTHPEGITVSDRQNYYGQIRIDPNDGNHVYVMGEMMYESTDGGKSWKQAFKFSDDHHDLWIDPDDSNHMILGNDHGVALTYDSGQNWNYINYLPLAQVYAIGVDMDYPYNVYCGTQDNGSWRGPSTKKGRFPIRFEDWEHIGGGDGFYCQVDPTNSRWLYNESQFGGITRVDQETGKRRRLKYRKNNDIRFNWNAPILISPHNSNVIYHGANMLLYSPSRGEEWHEISPDLTTNDPQKIHGIGAVQYCTITTVDESPVEQGVIWVGTDDGNVYLTRDGGGTWKKLNDFIPDNPVYWVSRISASHHHAGTAYLTYTGFYRDDFKPYVYKTTDFGETWKSIASNLPDEPINVIKEDHKNPNLLFVGTDKSVYVSIDSGKNWLRMKNNMPTCPVHDLVIHPRENDLVVGTHGRGIFITDISPLQELTPDVLSANVFLFEIEPKVQWIMPHQTVVSYQNFEGNNEAHGVVINYYLKDAVKEGINISIFDGNSKINEIFGPNSKGINSVEWYMTRRIKRSEEEITRWERQQDRIKSGVEFYCQYDEVDYYGEADEEVDKWGRSLRTYVLRQPYITDREYAAVRVNPGKYKVVLSAGDMVLTRSVVIPQDYWYK
jgi:photosystem II stability/assembly factor-like uncharacterized protein